jgi:cyclohexa-1,5-dienecarbonyl-CoA hydratase
MANAVQVTKIDEGAWWHVVFGGSRGNILDGELMEALTALFVDAAGAQSLKAIVLDGAGPDFSFGSSIEEHLPDRVAQMLGRFHRMLLACVDSSVLTIAAVRGQCLGGGLELATMCHRIVASGDARFGQPEIALGVFAPVASVALAERVGRSSAEDLCLTGRFVDADEALRMGLVDQIAVSDPVDLALSWLRAHLEARSPSTLRLAVRAMRADFAARLRRQLPQMEQLYLDELMKTPDAVEGLRAFLEKRSPRWQ